jgi:trans-aconitate 2-methyltransferase
VPADAWDPEQYHRFRRQRAAPFHDLLALLQPVDRPRVVDLGCGTGELTALLHERTAAAETVGVDRSPAMLAEAAPHAAPPALRFVEGDIATFPTVGDEQRWDVVVANASLQWIPDHRSVLSRWTAALSPGGQLAVQVPANADHPSHQVAAEVAASGPFANAFGPDGPPPDPVHEVLAPEEYACLLDELGFVEQHVRLQVYGMRLPSSADVVEWVKGTTLTRFQGRLPAPLFGDFVERYRRRLLEVIGDRSPYFYAFKRILLWGRR